MSWIKFAHVALSCRDIDRIERFYTAHFGFHRARVIPLGETKVVYIRAGDVWMELFQAEGEPPVGPFTGDGPHYPGLRHVAFQVDDVDAKLRALGDEVKVTLGPMSFDDFIPGWRTVWVADPEGNIVEISQGYVDQENPPALD